jgi:N-acetylglucosaminyldiphosphoundecaprenol N-acetyl-beta-D-mannosaminyltransferase
VSAVEQRRNGRAHVLGCEIDRVDMTETLERCERFIRTRTRAQHMAVNAAKIVSSHNDEELHRLINGCDIVTADGQAVVWASRVLGDPLPSRVAGVDLMNELLALAERRGYRVFILGAKQDVLDRALERLRERHPRLEVAGHRDGYYAAGEERAVVDQIRASRPDLLFVAMPSPRKEYFLGRWGDTLDVPFAMGVGGAIDVLAGVTRRAPRRLQVLGLEWAYRLGQEPRRLLRRYLVTNSLFIVMTLRSAGRRRRSIHEAMRRQT